MQVSREGKKWIEIAAFVLCVAGLMAVLSGVFDPMERGLSQAVNERDIYVISALGEPENTIDTAILGDSEALVLADPSSLGAKTGRNVYIIGQSGQTLSEAYEALQTLSEKQKLTLVLLEADMLADESNIRRDLTESFDTAAYRVFPVLRFHGIWKPMTGGKMPQVPAHERGFSLRTEEVPYTGGEYMHPTDQLSPICITSEWLMDRIVKYCKEKGIRLVMVSAPAPLHFSMEKHNALADYAKKRSLAYLDLNLLTEEIGIDYETDMLDGGDHVNLKGSEKITEYLAGYLNENE